jgi:hypothetical protein
VAVHFFQRRARRVETSTLFLIEALVSESEGGRTWERFRGSRSFWLQVLEALLVVWVWAEPRWPRADSRQTVVIVLDDALAERYRAAYARHFSLWREAAKRAAVGFARVDCAGSLTGELAGEARLRGVVEALA